MTFEQAVDYINDIPRFTSKNNPTVTRAFLNKIGDISMDIPVIHVAGTNGKGSVCAYLRKGLMASGKRVMMFTSPHLVSICERFQMDEECISESEFVECFDRVIEKVNEVSELAEFENYHPTFFEYLFFMAMIWAQKRKPDVCILETGLGGRLDATNSILAPAITVITEIGLDHCEYLGNTREEIAGEKAGIVKATAPLVYCDRYPTVNEVFINTCKQVGTKAYAVGMKNIKNFRTSAAGLEFSLGSLYDKNADFLLKTRALYQAENAALAYTALELLKDALLKDADFEMIRSSFSTINWPGRMERLSSGLIIDGAHNEDGIDAFIESVSVDGALRRTLIYSAVSDKHIEGVADKILKSGLFDTIFLTVLNSYRAADRERLEAAFLDSNVTIYFCENVREALRASEDNATEGCSCYAAGSLYLVGEIKELYHD